MPRRSKTKLPYMKMMSEFDIKTGRSKKVAMTRNSYGMLIPLRFKVKRK